MTNGRNKGANFERECAKLIFDELGIQTKRDLEQYRAGDHGDLIGLDGWTIECKRYANNAGGNFKPEWWAQVTEAANFEHNQPVLLSSINSDYAGKDNVATVSFPTWCMLVREGLCDV